MVCCGCYISFSLFKVQPFAGIIDTVKYGVPRVLFNWNAVGPFRSGKRNQDVVATGIVTYLSSSSPMGHKASTISRHLPLSFATY